jgi:hypothetical protein
MRKRFTLLSICNAILLLWCIHGKAQVYNGDLIFSNQTDIDNFTNFSYTSVNGDLLIDDASDGQHDIRNLAGLAALTSVSGYVSVRNNNLLTNTIYLNLVSVGGASFSNNPALTTINGMTGLISLQGQLTIESNASLTAVTAFSGLTSIGLGLYIQNNPALTNLSGFSNLATVSASMLLGNNNSLANLTAFSNLTSVETQLTIRNHVALTTVNGLAALTSVGLLNIENNAVLTNLDGLGNLKTIGQGFVIQQNALLQNINGLSNLDTLGVASFLKNNNALSAISGFSNLTRMGSLYIELNPALTTISGFSNLRSLGTLSIIHNLSLTSLTGFPVLDSIYSDFILDHNESLTTVNAFPNLVYVRNRMAFIINYALATVNAMPQLDSVGSVEMVADTLLPHLNFLSNLHKGGSLLINGCYGLTNLNFLSNLRLVKGDLSIANNRRLASISALSGMTSVGGSLIVGNSPALLTLQGLENITKIGEDLTISGNPQLPNINELIRLDSIGGILTVFGNSNLPELNGLFNLRKAYSVVIQNNAALVEFCGLYRLYSGGEPELGFSIIAQNLVNPTPQQIIDAGPCAVIPLPVVLKVFNLRCESNKVILNWITTSEISNSHFALQRSSNGTAWIDLGIIPASGNNGGDHSYSFTDDQPLSNSFYRLAQYDLDGKVHYSSIIRSRCSAESDIALWPNPASDKVVINIQSTNASAGLVRMFDSKGALVKIQRATILQGSNQINVDMKKLASGVYQLAIEWNNGQMKKAVQIVKQ